MFLAQFDLHHALSYVFVFARVAALCMTLPKLVTDRYFLFYRILLAAVVTFAIAPLATQNSSIQISENRDWISILLAEVGIGLCLGLAASCVILGFTAAGQIVSQALGFQIGSLQQGQNAEQATDYRKLFLAAGVFFWFSISGHRLALEGVLNSFVEFPAGHFHFSNEIFWLFNDLIAASLEFAIRFSLPVVAVAIIGFIVAGLSSRILGSSQTTSTAFVFNQILFFAIAIPMFLVMSEETYRLALGQVEDALTSLTEIQVR